MYYNTGRWCFEAPPTLTLFFNLVIVTPQVFEPLGVNMAKHMKIFIPSLVELVLETARLDTGNGTTIPTGVIVDLPGTRDLDCAEDSGLYLNISFNSGTSEPSPYYKAWYDSCRPVECELHGVKYGWKPITKLTHVCRSHTTGAGMVYWDIIIPTNNMLDKIEPYITLASIYD